MLNQQVKKIIQSALDEDKVSQDKTTAITVVANKRGQAVIFANQSGILCGVRLVKFIFKKINKKTEVKLLAKDGDRISKNQRVVLLSGNLQSILKAERVALNFLSLLSGIATSTNMFVKKAKQKKVIIKDTRKTTPCLRYLEKYAVSVGGGKNHRLNLADGIIVKENHLRAAGVITANEKVDHLQLEKLWRKLRSKTKMPIEVEVENFTEFKEVARYSPDVIMLDNFSQADLKKAASYRNKNFPEIELEASGGVTLKNLEAIASAGIDSISVGSITHSPDAMDFSLEITTTGLK